MVGQVALNVHDDIVPPLRIEDVGRLLDAVRARGMVVAGQHGAAAGLLDHVDDARLVGRDGDRADAGFHGAAPDMHDHRLAMDIGQRLAGQARRGHAGGNQDQRVGHRGRLGWAVGGTAGSVKRSQSGGCLYELHCSAQSG
jgi:hypothetical protein